MSALAVSVALSSATLPAYAVSRSVSGRGGGGLQGCGGFLPASLSFNATIIHKATTGNFTISWFSNGQFFFSESGIFTGGRITHHAFKLEGLATVAPLGCAVGVPFMITGDCGSGVTITITEIGGSILGTLTGTATCTK